MLPPISDPTPKIEHLALIKPPSPPELPPTALCWFQGLTDLPQRLLLVSALIQYWGTLDFMNGMAPAFFKHIIKHDYSYTLNAFAFKPRVVANPLKLYTSFNDIGTPNRGGRYSFYRYCEIFENIQFFRWLFYLI